MSAPADDRRALLDAAKAARIASDFLGLERLGRKLIDAGKAAGDADIEAVGYYHLGIALNSLNRGSEAIQATRESIKLYEKTGDRFAAARAMMNLGSIELDNHGNVSEARRLYELSAPVVRELGEPLHLAIALGNLGEICRLEGDYRGALRNAHESLEIFRRLGEVDNIVWQLVNIAHFELLLKRYDPAVESMGEAFELLRADPNPRWMAAYFDTWFLIAAGLRRFDVAAQLLAFADKYRGEQNQPRLAAMLPWLSSPIERLTRELPLDRYEALAEAGESLTVESAQRLAETIGS